VNGGPNLISSFHPIGNIWSRFWMQGSLSNDPFRLMQTVEINPGSCAILEIKYPVPEIVRLADHSITRTARKGLLAEIEVSGKPVPELFQAITS
jgi:nitrite reductase (NO-forming)